VITNYKHEVVSGNDNVHGCGNVMRVDGEYSDNQKNRFVLFCFFFLHGPRNSEELNPLLFALQRTT